MTQALVLNMTYEPLCVVSTRRALTLVMDHKAEALEVSGRTFRSQLRSFDEPTVIRLAHYVRVPYQRKIALNRRAIFLRDGGRCQYCGTEAENIDHVIPKSRGGPHEWENVVAACKRCNSRKEDRLPEEAGLKLFRKPFRPKEKIWILARSPSIRQEWALYLGLSLAEGKDQRYQVPSSVNSKIVSLAPKRNTPLAPNRASASKIAATSLL
jgi:5-methylcytosine-specific restriction endonuclease McrA